MYEMYTLNLDLQEKRRKNLFVLSFPNNTRNFVNEYTNMRIVTLVMRVDDVRIGYVR